MKKISVMLPTFNEQENITPITQLIIKIFKDKLPQYEYEIVIIDNFSTDGTRDCIENLCAEDKNIKAIFNARNFGQFNSPFYGICQTTGDCTICLCSDFQEPPEMIPEFVKEWEKGSKIILGIKTSSRENRILYFLRTCYYKIIKKFSEVEQIEHFTGFGLYDKSFVSILQELKDPSPFLRGIVAELGFKRKNIPYTQQERRAGKTKNNMATLYDAAMLSFTSYTKVGLRMATILGFIFSGISMVIALVYLFLKLLYWDQFLMGMAPVLIGVFLFGSVQMFFTGLLGEYVMNINTKVIKRPLVIEEKRINFDIKSEQVTNYGD